LDVAEEVSNLFHEPGGRVAFLQYDRFGILFKLFRFTFVGA